MSDAVDVSVVVVTFNNENEIADCIDSLARELENDRWQLMVIDNCSADRTSETVRLKLSALDAIGISMELICNQENLGFTRALNQGLRKSHGEFILILNPDTRLQQESLRILKKKLYETDLIGVAAPQLLNADGSVQSSCRRFPRHRDVIFEMTGLSSVFKSSQLFSGWKMGDFDHRVGRSVDQPQGACLFFRRSVLNAVGLWDERFPMFFSDVDWCRRVKKAGFDIVFEPAAKVVHHKGVSVHQKRPRMIWSSQRSFFRYFMKHYDQPKYFLANYVTGFLLLVTAVPRILFARLKKP